MKKPIHTVMNQFSVQDNSLIVGGMSIKDLAIKMGRTPFYAYDKQVIAQKVETFKKFIPSRIKLHYAIKANPMPDVVQFLSGLVDGFDLASLGEMNVALDTSMPSEKISFAGPGKRQEELNASIMAGVTINIESSHELTRIIAGAETIGKKPRVAIRVNPDFELKSSGMKMGGGPKQFGIDTEIVPEVLKDIGKLDVEFMGFHIFSGSQNLSAEAIIEAHNKTLDLAVRLSEHAPSVVKKLNIGGGFGIPYFPGESHLDLAPIGKNLETILPKLDESIPGVDVIIELGRYLVGESGVYVCQIIEKKISRGETFLIVDGGLHHHLAASGNFGQVIRKNYPVAIGNKIQGKNETVSIVGPLCTPLDILGSKMDLPKAEAGDFVVIFQSGAYGYTASPHAFLSHPPPLQILV
ncbi:MAG: pyridoxal-dependent decarboxylase, exosortase A system-associated [Gammaproteobacteria bacterium]|nr:pyridoxal-dependent decarboxylase, exosortase A system-associated [Gammaproteobacteria bacterium]